MFKIYYNYLNYFYFWNYVSYYNCFSYKNYFIYYGNYDKIKLDIKYKNIYKVVLFKLNH